MTNKIGKQTVETWKLETKLKTERLSLNLNWIIIKKDTNRS